MGAFDEVEFGLRPTGLWLLAHWLCLDCVGCVPLPAPTSDRRRHSVPFMCRVRVVCECDGSNGQRRDAEAVPLCIFYAKAGKASDPKRERQNVMKTDSKVT